METTPDANFAQVAAELGHDFAGELRIGGNCVAVIRNGNGVHGSGQRMPRSNWTSSRPRVDPPRTRVPRMERIVVVGTSCAGKSTLARSLAAALDTRCVELDDLYWGPDWTPKPHGEFVTLVACAAAADRWVIEGNYGDVRPLLWPRATTVVWLNYGPAVVAWRALRRTTHRVATRRELWHGNRESFRRSFLSRDSILLWVLTTYRRRRRQFAALRAANTFAHLDWIELRTPAEASRFLQRVGGAR